MLAELDLAREEIVALRREGRRQAGLAHTDGLTGLLNRRAWDIALEEALSASSLRMAPLSVVILDIDHFKTYNDRFGHPAGDRLLEGAASRWGGAHPRRRRARPGGRRGVRPHPAGLPDRRGPGAWWSGCCPTCRVARPPAPASPGCSGRPDRTGPTAQSSLRTTTRMTSASGSTTPPTAPFTGRRKQGRNQCATAPAVTIWAGNRLVNEAQ